MQKSRQTSLYLEDFLCLKTNVNTASRVSNDLTFLSTDESSNESTNEFLQTAASKSTESPDLVGDLVVLVVSFTYRSNFLSFTASILQVLLGCRLQ